MKTLQIEVNITEERQLTVQLPDDVALGKHQIVLVIQPQADKSQPHHQLNELAGQVHSFSDLDPVQWQQQIRDEWDDQTVPA